MAVEYKPIVLDETIKQHFEKVDEQTNKLILALENLSSLKYASMAQEAYENVVNRLTEANDQIIALESSISEGKSINTTLVANIDNIRQITANINTWANSAESSANNAKLSEQNAKTSETNASKYATTASNKAELATTKCDLTHDYMEQAKGYANNAKVSETNSKTSETNAKTSETNALAYRNELKKGLDNLTIVTGFRVENITLIVPSIAGNVSNSVLYLNW